MKTKITVILTLIFALIVQISFAQTKTISGNVTDESGPLPGVGVVIKGTTTGAETDFDGNYSINAAVGDVLQFSFIGMKTSEQTVGAASTINVVLASDTEALNEVVVVAYGTQTKESIVGAVTVVDNEIIEKQQVVSVVNALQGSVPGVNIIASGGQPGDNPIIRIRGVSSINADASPLIILDGSPFNGNLNTISSDQIESMNVLKDASATSLYGSRGANGVILIITKQGRKNSPTQVTVRSTVGFADQAVAPHNVMGIDDSFIYTWEAMRNANQYEGGQDPATAGINASNALIPGLGYNPYGPSVPVPVDANGNLVTSNKLWDTDWRDPLFNDSAVRTEHGLTASGGTENSTFFFSANYLDQEGSIQESDFERITTRINVNTTVNDWLDLGLSSAYSTSKQNNPTQSGSGFQASTQWASTVSPIYPIYRHDENGVLLADGFGNPIYDYGNTAGQATNGVRAIFEGENAVGALYNYEHLNKRHQFNANGYVTINFNEHLNFKTTLGYEQYTFDSFDYISSEVGYAASVGGRVDQDRDITTTTNLINALNYNNSFGEHNVGASLIHEAYKFKLDRLGAQGVGFLPNVQVLNGSTTPESVSGAVFEERIESYLGRVTYNYKNKYYAEGSYRRDGSTKFSEDTRWGDFYSFGASWVVSKESFLENNDILSYLRVKASYGELGNNRILDANGNQLYFPYTSNFQTGWNELTNTGVIVPGVNDPNLTWETTASFNAGIDFRLFNDKINGTVDYYEKESVDLIYDKPLPGSTGFTDITTNVGAVKNSGVEVSLNANIIRKENFEWSVGLNMAFEKNEITELTQDEFITPTGSKKWKVGTSLYEFFVREYAGVDPSNGDALWYEDVLDTDGEPTGDRVTTNDYANATRYQTGKESLADVTGGFTTNVRYKNFDLNLLFNFSSGAYVLDGTYQGLMSGFEQVGRAASPDLVNRWQQPGDITDIPRLSNANNDFNGTSDRFLFKNDYIRLKALNFGYNFDADIAESIGLSSLRLYFQGDNLLTFQSHEGIDPEQSLAGTTINRSYNQRIYSLGIKIEL